jgi:hypothetical protein
MPCHEAHLLGPRWLEAAAPLEGEYARGERVEDPQAGHKHEAHDDLPRGMAWRKAPLCDAIPDVMPCYAMAFHVPITSRPWICHTGEALTRTRCP